MAMQGESRQARGGEGWVRVCRTYLLRDIMEEMALNGIAPDRQFLESAIRLVILWPPRDMLNTALNLINPLGHLSQGALGVR